MRISDGSSDVCSSDLRFVEGDLYRAPELIAGRFDLVYVTWGTICWLPDLPGWAKVAAHFLKPGGRLYFCDAHPAARVFDDSPEAAALPRSEGGRVGKAGVGTCSTRWSAFPKKK